MLLCNVMNPSPNPSVWQRPFPSFASWAAKLQALPGKERLARSPIYCRDKRELDLSWSSSGTSGCSTSAGSAPHTKYYNTTTGVVGSRNSEEENGVADQSRASSSTFFYIQVIIIVHKTKLLYFSSRTRRRLGSRPTPILFTTKAFRFHFA